MVLFFYSAHIYLLQALLLPGTLLGTGNTEMYKNVEKSIPHKSRGLYVSAFWTYWQAPPKTNLCPLASFKVSCSDGHFLTDSSGESTSPAFFSNSGMKCTTFIWNMYQIIREEVWEEIK